MPNIPPPLWLPPEKSKKASNLTGFCALLGVQPSMNDLFAWSTQHPATFWSTVWDFFKVTGSKGSRILTAPDTPDPIERFIATSFFSDGTLNFACNLLQGALDSSTADTIAISFYGENIRHEALTYRQLAHAVVHTRKLLQQDGIQKGDVVAGIVPNCPLAIIAMLATTSLGAIWTSCSPDFGVEGIIDRFGQTSPKIIFTTDGYIYKTVIPLGEKISQSMTAIPSVKKVYWWNFTGDGQFKPQGSFITEQIEYLLDAPPQLQDLRNEIQQFEQFDFNHPLYIMYSSGTTGKPKCIMHRAGGVLLEQVKEWGLHVEVSSNDVCFYQTTCGWMMWNWLVAALFFKTKIVLFDGFPVLHDGAFLLGLIEKEKISIFGTNAKFLSLIEKLETVKKYSLRFDSLHTILSTGSPLSAESFSFVYDQIKKDVCLSSISGGTDILGCFALGSPTLPVYQGELQCRSLGLAVSCFDDNNQEILNTPGELVCTAPFPSMPLGFWNDPDNQKFRAAYFEDIPGVWRHGDLVVLTDRGTMIFLGRSDTTLNPGGIRIGSAEIYSKVDAMDFVEESVVIGRRNSSGTDETMILFVKLKNNSVLTDAHQHAIRKELKEKCSPHHVPKEIYAVTDIPKTRSGKIVEAAVRATAEGSPIKNLQAIANPECLVEFEVARVAP